MALLFFPNWVHVINELFSWQLVASPVRGAPQRQAGVWAVLQGSCYMRGSASLSAQTDISRVPVEDAEVRGVFLHHDPVLGSQGTLLLLSALLQMWGGNFKSTEMGVGTGNFSFLCSFSSVHLGWIVSNNFFSLWDTLRYMFKTSCERELLLLLLIHKWALQLLLVHLAGSHSSWEFSTAGEGCSQQHYSQGVKMGCFSVLCFFISLSRFMLHVPGTSGHSLHLLFLPSGIAPGPVPGELWRGFLPGSQHLQG